MTDTKTTDSQKTAIQQAVFYLQQGELVALPTETVYGLAADAENKEAIRKIYQLKNRPLEKALVINIADISQIEKWAKNIPALFYMLAEKYWPGPVTFILEARKNAENTENTGKTIGIRMPRHPVTQEILKQFGGAVVMPSANYSGNPSPVNAAEVRAEWGAKIPLIIDGGESQYKKESTLLDLTHQPPRILRHGVVPAEELEQYIKTILKLK